MSLFVSSPAESQELPPSQTPMVSLAPPSQAGFEGTTKHIKIFASLLNSVLPINNQCLLSVKSTGLTFYTSHNHLIDILLIVDSSLFNIYTFHGETELQVDLSLLANSFSSVDDKETTCFIQYKNDGILTVEFEGFYILEKLGFYTYTKEIDDDGNLLIDYQDIVFELIIKSNLLYLLLTDLIKLGTLELNLVVSPSGIYFISKSNIGLIKLIYPNSLIEKLETAVTVSQTYNFINFIKIIQAIKISSKCKLIKDSLGILCLQLLYDSHLITFNLLEQEVDTLLNFDDDKEYNYVKTYNGDNDERNETDMNDHIDLDRVVNIPNQVPMFL